MAGLEHGCLHELLPHINVVRSCRLGVWFTVHNHVDLGPRHGCFKSFGGPYDSSTLYNNINYSRESNAKWGKLTRWEKLASLTRKRSLSSESACVLIQVALLWYRYLTNWEAKNVLRWRQLETKSASIMTYSLNTHTYTPHSVINDCRKTVSKFCRLYILLTHFYCHCHQHEISLISSTF